MKKVVAVITALALVPLAACASAEQRAAYEANEGTTRTEVVVAAPADVVFGRAMSAFVDAGLTVADADRQAGFLRSAPSHRPAASFAGGLIGGSDRIATIYIANLVALGDSTRVVVSGRWELEEADSPSSGERPVTPNMPEEWAVVQQIADAIRGDAD